MSVATDVLGLFNFPQFPTDFDSVPCQGTFL